MGRRIWCETIRPGSLVIGQQFPFSGNQVGAFKIPSTPPDIPNLYQRTCGQWAAYPDILFRILPGKQHSKISVQIAIVDDNSSSIRYFHASMANWIAKHICELVTEQLDDSHRKRNSLQSQNRQHEYGKPVICCPHLGHDILQVGQFYATARLVV